MVLGPDDAVLDLAPDPLPEWFGADADICVVVAGIVDTYAPAHSMSAEQWSGLTQWGGWQNRFRCVKSQPARHDSHHRHRGQLPRNHPQLGPARHHRHAQGDDAAG